MGERSPTPAAATWHPLFLLERAWVQWLSRPFVAALARLGVRPNAVTFAAFALKVAAAPLMFAGRYEAAGGLWIAGAVGDALDGALARALGSGTRLGAFLDAGLDRVAGALLVAAFAAGLGTPSAYAVALAVVTVSLLHALVKAQGAALGVGGGGPAAAPPWPRLLHRSGRSVWLSASLILGPAALAPFGGSPGDALLIAFSALACVTALALVAETAGIVRALRR